VRDKRFIAEHRGGVLTKEQHRQLIQWACACVEKVLPLFGEEPDSRLLMAIHVAGEWKNGSASVGEARKAALEAIALANETLNPVSEAVARAAGHAAATAHMADHALGAALYAMKAVKTAGKSVEAERKWQNDQLPFEILDLVTSSRTIKEKFLRI